MTTPYRYVHFAHSLLPWPHPIKCQHAKYELSKSFHYNQSKKDMRNRSRESRTQTNQYPNKCAISHMHEKKKGYVKAKRVNFYLSSYLWNGTQESPPLVTMTDLRTFSAIFFRNISNWLPLRPIYHMVRCVAAKGQMLTVGVNRWVKQAVHWHEEMYIICV